MATHDSVTELPLGVAHNIIRDRTEDPTVRSLAIRQFSGFVPTKHYTILLEIRQKM